MVVDVFGVLIVVIIVVLGVLGVLVVLDSCCAWYCSCSFSRVRAPGVSRSRKVR